MTPEQRRAHLVLIGQPLLDEWLEFCKMYDASPGSRGRAIDKWRDAVSAEYGGRWEGVFCGAKLENFMCVNGDYYLHPNTVIGEPK